MSQLSPKAMRFIDKALILQGDSRDASEWHSWVNYSETELPPYVAQIALHALSGLALNLEKQIGDSSLNDFDAAQIENDLGYISDIEAALTKYLYPPTQSAYG